MSNLNQMTLRPFHPDDAGTGRGEPVDGARRLVQDRHDYAERPHRGLQCRGVRLLVDGVLLR